MKESSGGHDELKSKRIRICDDPETTKKIKAPAHRVTKECPSPAPRVLRALPANYDSAGRVPRGPKATEERRLSYQRQCERCAETALKFFNQSEEAKKLGGYELVKAMGTSPFMCGMEGMWYHANFVAKPVNALNDDDKSIVFFAELKLCFPRPLECNMCCILGPHEYGTHGCENCKDNYPMLRHPKEGFRISCETDI